MTTTQICKVCKRELPVEQFKPAKTKSGRLGICKECQKKRREIRKFIERIGKIEFECEHCHKKFYLYKSYYEKAYASKGFQPRFCSAECAREHEKEGFRTCKHCGKLLPLENFTKRGRNYTHVCKKCASVQNKRWRETARFTKREGTTEYVCKNCGKKFYMTAGQIKHGHNTQFCCRECREVYEMKLKFMRK